jgi:hypothetical protein
MVDHGEFETQDGNIIVLKKNSQVFEDDAFSFPTVKQSYNNSSSKALFTSLKPFGISLRLLFKFYFNFHNTKDCYTLCFAFVHTIESIFYVGILVCIVKR